MRDAARADHVQVHVGQAIEQMPPPFHQGAMERMLPNGTQMPRAQIVLLRHSPGGEVHHA